MDLTAHWFGFVPIGIFVLANSLVIAEEYIHLRKSRPVMLAAGVIQALIAFQYSQSGSPYSVHLTNS